MILMDPNDLNGEHLRLIFLVTKRMGLDVHHIVM